MRLHFYNFLEPYKMSLSAEEQRNPLGDNSYQTVAIVELRGPITVRPPGQLHLTRVTLHVYLCPGLIICRLLSRD